MSTMRISFMTLGRLATVSFLGCSALSCLAAENDDVPVAPIAASMFQGWTNAFHLRNGELEVVVVPETGRIGFVGFSDGANLLRVDESLAGKHDIADAPDYWFNFGGDWIWPVAQSRWPDFQDGDWPPSRLLDGRAWEGRAWKSADGGQCCLVSQTYGEPLNIEVTRFVKLHKNLPSVEVRQKLERIAPSDIPVTLWNISQVAGARQAVLPIDEDSGFEGGITPIKFGAPAERLLSRCEGAVVYHVEDKGEHKLGSDSGRAWIAARKGNTLIVERVTPYDENGPYPDGGCCVEMYCNAGLGYVEIETFSPERNLAVGETLDNTLHIICYRVKPDVTDCQLARKVMELIGDTPEDQEAENAPAAEVIPAGSSAKESTPAD